MTVNNCISQTEHITSVLTLSGSVVYR